MGKRAIDAIRGQIIEAMKNGTSPWQKDWTPTAGVSQPFNGKSGRRYTGWANTLNLFLSADLRGYQSPRWVTFKQAQEAGLNVRKGEKGTHVEFWKSYTPKKKDDERDDSDEQSAKRLACRVYSVFNEDQLDGPLETPPETEPVTRNVQFVLDMAKAAGADILFGGGDKAYYRPALDMIRSPDLDQYNSEAGAIVTLIHELIHWTGAEARLNRDVSCYATEELVAEAGSWLTAMELGLPYSPQNSTSYLAGWAKRTNDPEAALDKAMSDAQRASRYLIDAAKAAGLMDDWAEVPREAA